MFSLIITIISIALVAALAVASVYYGGNAFSQGTAKANASALVAQAQQIAAANTLYANDNSGVLAADTATLKTGGYLASVPEPNDKVSLNDYEFAGRVVTLSLNDGATEVAKQVNLQAGLAEAPADVSGSAPTDEAGWMGLSGQFGVVDTNGDATGGLVFFYKG